MRILEDHALSTMAYLFVRYLNNRRTSQVVLNELQIFLQSFVDLEPCLAHDVFYETFQNELEVGSYEYIYDVVNKAKIRDHLHYCISEIGDVGLDEDTTSKLIAMIIPCIEGALGKEIA